MNHPKVPFVALDRLHQAIRPELDEAFARVLVRGQFILGSEIARFEENWAAFVGCRHAIGCSNGTDALILALRALGIRSDDEVVTTSHTFFATIEAIVAVGARPVLADIDSRTGLIDPVQVEACLTPRTKAIIAVHLYGQPPEMDWLRAIAQPKGIFLVEDSAQAHGAEYRSRSAGTLGDIAAFSFFPGKNLGALGDAGAVTTNSDILANRVRLLRDHGRTEKYLHRAFAGNMRMDALQGAFLNVKLSHVRRWNGRRQSIADQYRRSLNGLAGITLLEQADHIRHSNHLFVILADNRALLSRELREQGIETGIHYPVPCHRQPAWADMLSTPNLPHTEAFADRCLSLPIHGEMTDDEAQLVISAIHHISRER